MGDFRIILNVIFLLLQNGLFKPFGGLPTIFRSQNRHLREILVREVQMPQGGRLRVVLNRLKQANPPKADKARRQSGP